MTICTPWRVGNALNKLLNQLDVRWPARSRLSDGSIGDALHQASACGSQHNSCCVKYLGVWVIRARDFTHDPAHGADMAKVSEQLRLSRDPRIRYVIFNRRITGPSYAWTWHSYTGDNPHDKHMHVSVVDTQARYDSTADWRIEASGPAKAQEELMYAGTYFSATGAPGTRFFGIPGVLCSWVQGTADASLSALEDGQWIDPIAPAHTDGAAPTVDRSLINIVGTIPPGFEDRAAFKPLSVDVSTVAHQIAVELADDPDNPLTQQDIPALASAMVAKFGEKLGTVQA